MTKSGWKIRYEQMLNHRLGRTFQRGKEGLSHYQNHQILSLGKGSQKKLSKGSSFWLVWGSAKSFSCVCIEISFKNFFCLMQGFGVGGWRFGLTLWFYLWTFSYLIISNLYLTINNRKVTAVHHHYFKVKVWCSSTLISLWLGCLVRATILSSI